MLLYYNLQLFSEDSMQKSILGVIFLLSLSLTGCAFDRPKPEAQATADIKRCSAHFDFSKMTENDYREYTLCMAKSVEDYRSY